MSKPLSLQEAIPKAIGTLSFDENNQLIESTGIGKDRINDIVEIGQMELDKNGYGVVSDKDVLVNVFKQAGKTVVVYTPNK
ncbi:DUF3215 domain-containing protein TDEL_0A07630 [Torulaspora delbrueckii]|uniref:Uncharacterized protein n=1 Tax=Torulaspora delbrueckii TaxID=4950 RepID=G8ZNA1_TORDE|nr:hypothetical protein TDEL_0A07630 [Torulaspora delbrueckii]CCE90095.1 hypothetical protein TDEL_0A07630 [Torulaspora delbrueckii]